MKLSNTLYALNVKKSLRVAYFGGSITEGGAQYGWRGKTTAWLKERWPEARVTEIMAAIGGTGSELGVYRCDTDVVSQAPDLTFVEFAVNDSGAQPELTAKNIEAIVRKLLRANPLMDIVFAYTTTKRIDDALRAGGSFLSRDADEAVASYYNIPSVDIGAPLAEAVRAAGGDWLRYTSDTVHPNPDGYAFCAEASIGALTALLDAATPDQPVAHALPAPRTDDLPEDAFLADASGLCAEIAQPDTSVEQSWKKLFLTLCHRWPHAIGANRPGAELTIPFRGTAFGLYYMIASDSGILEWKIDQGEWRRLNTFDFYALGFARAAFVLLDSDLDDADHTAVLRVCAEKDPQSAGRWIRIGALGLRGQAQK